MRAFQICLREFEQAAFLTSTDALAVSDISSRNSSRCVSFRRHFVATLFALHFDTSIGNKCEVKFNRLDRLTFVSFSFLRSYHN
jgi:hypothetical protein